MQDWEDYEADYFRREPDWYDEDDGKDDARWGFQRDEHLCPVDRQGRRRCMIGPERSVRWRNGEYENRRRLPELRWEEPDRWMRRGRDGEPAESWEESVVDNTMEMIRDLDEFEKLSAPTTMKLLGLIRRMCDSMDGDGCIAMDGTLTGELKDMLVDRVMEEMEAAEQMDRESMGAMAVRDDETLRELIAQLLFQELLRRRHRRRHGRRRPPFENPRKRF